MRLPSLLAICFAGAVLMHPANAALARQGKDKASRDNPALLQMPRGGAGLRDTRDPGVTPDSAAREIQRRHGGRVLAVQPDGSGYRVKMLKDGEVRIYQVDP